MFAPPRARCARRVRPAGAASASSAAVWRRYPKRDGKGRIEWIHWADLELAAAWAEQALVELDGFVAKYSGATASATQLDGGGRAPITTDAYGVLRSLNTAFQALNVPPIVAPESEEFGAVDLIRSFVVLSRGRVEVRTQLVLSSGSRGPSSTEQMAALWRSLGVRELASDEGVVVDVRTRRTAFRGAFDAALAFKRGASDGDRAFFALWARRPWTLVRAEGETELVWSAPLVWERDRIVRKLELTRQTMQSIARDPWEALVAARARVKANNDELAIEWAGQMPELASTTSARQVESIRESMQAIAQARSEQELARARALAREGLATGAGSIAGVLGVLSAAAPPAALVLAPTAAVLGALAALAGLFLQLIPREWLATAEVTPPRLPLPNMITGYEAADAIPSHNLDAPPSFDRVARRVDSAPPPLESMTATAVVTMNGTAAPPSSMSSLDRRRAPAQSAMAKLLAPRTGVPVAGPDDIRSTSPALNSEPLPWTAPTPARAPSVGARTAVAVAGVGALAALLVLTSGK